MLNGKAKKINNSKLLVAGQKNHILRLKKIDVNSPRAIGYGDYIYMVFQLV